ncbi:MAG: hypothetical protein PHU49_04245 [Syntrophorhabdaceae bacterium]|nr:hypothetical protein [Syntrophorhabdaceae bacterium]MDD5243206.1 hypothetical protein [Syntrophorhabdaceae bacterium]
MVRKQLVYLLVISLLVINGGCGVLTKTQVKEVNKFAVAAKNYSEMPGIVIEEHAKIRKNRQILMASTYCDGEAALEAIKTALTQQETLTIKGRQTDATLQVLKDYADLLVNLTSDNFTNELQASCETLGKNIDKGIGQYNKMEGTDLGLFGSGVAAIIRGLGGIYVRSEQEKALKQAITSADPVIRSMTLTIEEIMALYLDADQLQNIKGLTTDKGQSALEPLGLLTQEKKEVMEKYRATVGRYEGKQPPGLPLAVANEIEASDNAARLAASALKAADSYRQAHAALAKVVLEKQDLPDVIDVIQVLIDEVKAAQELKKKLDNK